MPTVLTTRAIHSPTIFFSAQNDGKERNGNNGRRQSLKPSSSNDRSSKGQQRYQQISTSIGKPTKDIVIARENIGTTVSLTAAAFGIGYFLGSNQNAWLTQILNKLPFSRNKPVDMAEVVVNEGAKETYAELFLIDKLDSATKASKFRVVNDTVMGGVSSSAMMPPSPNSPAYSQFAGVIRLENNGGFASVRRALPNVDASDYKGVYLKCKAVMKERDEAKQFLLLAKDAECSRNFANFKSAFTVRADEWEVKLFPFEKCFKKGERMGRPIERGPLNVKDMTELGLMVLRGEEAQVGKFALDVQELGFYV